MKSSLNFIRIIILILNHLVIKQGLVTPKKAKPSTVKTYNESYRSKGEPPAKDIYLSQYGSDEMFIENIQK
jgi:hypothetical protein